MTSKYEARKVKLFLERYADSYSGIVSVGLTGKVKYGVVLGFRSHTDLAWHRQFLPESIDSVPISTKVVGRITTQ